jgi:hypothetical protein
MSLGIIYAPTAKMIKYANDLASQTGAGLPSGYDLSYEVCHNFLDQNAPRKLDDQAREELRAIAPGAKVFLGGGQEANTRCNLLTTNWVTLGIPAKVRTKSGAERARISSWTRAVKGGDLESQSGTS